MQYRHEWKHEISIFDVLCLRQRLSSVMTPDPHARGGRYFVRSLYFDDLRDTALREKLDGVSRREKFRLRCYNGDDSYLVLEVKWDEYLPAVIRDLVQVPSARTGAFSKYAFCRVYG